MSTNGTETHEQKQVILTVDDRSQTPLLFLAYHQSVRSVLEPNIKLVPNHRSKPGQGFQVVQCCTDCEPLVLLFIRVCGRDHGAVVVADRDESCSQSLSERIKPPQASTACKLLYLHASLKY